MEEVNQANRHQAWYASWFDSPYYPLLYKHRDYAEAADFIDRICQYLQLEPGSKALDLACGRGRHALVMARQGLSVTGLDLSESSLIDARKLAASHPALALRFARHDMREVYAQSAFDVVFNLFTSFGYFDEPADDKKVLDAIFTALRPGGLFVFDYLHAAYVEETHVPSEELEVDGVRFSVSRHITAAWIVKQIQVQDGDDAYRFFEKVRNYSPQQLEGLLQATGFSVLRKFGNYQLEPPSPESPRCLFICQK